MKSTIKDVAKMAGVSMKTVSRVFNKEPNVSLKTQEKVLIASKALQYTPNLAARGLASSKSYLLALIYGNASPNYIADIQRGAIAACREGRYHLIPEPITLGMSGNPASDSLGASETIEAEQLLASLPVDGVILIPPISDNQDVIDILERLNIAYVSVGPSAPPKTAPSVVMDDVQAAYEMTKFILSKGHKTVGFIKGPPDHNVSGLRYQGFARAMQAAGVPVNPDWIAEGDFTFRSGVSAAEKLLGQPVRPGAIFASNDDMATGVISVASRMGLILPQDLSVAGFDDLPLARIVWPPLTTIRQPIYAMGHMAASLLIQAPRRY